MPRLPWIGISRANLPGRCFWDVAIGKTGITNAWCTFSGHIYILYIIYTYYLYSYVYDRICKYIIYTYMYTHAQIYNDIHRYAYRCMAYTLFFVFMTLSRLSSSWFLLIHQVHRRNIFKIHGFAIPKHLDIFSTRFSFRIALMKII